MKKVTFYPYVPKAPTPDSIAFSDLTEKQADDLILAFAKAGFYVSSHYVDAESIQHVVHVEIPNKEN